MLDLPHHRFHRISNRCMTALHHLLQVLVPVAGFSQQGQVDWVAMGNSVFSMSYNILQRFADAGIQPLTHHARLAISAQFRLGEKGNQRVRDALDNLRISYGFESGPVVRFWP